MDQPVALSARTLIALLLAAVVLSAGVAFAAVTLAQPQPADAQVAKASSVISELKKLNRNIGSYEFTGPSSLRKTTRELVNATEDVKRQIETACRALAERSYSC